MHNCNKRCQNDLVSQLEASSFNLDQKKLTLKGFLFHILSKEKFLPSIIRVVSFCELSFVRILVVVFFGNCRGIVPNRNYVIN